MNKYSNMCQTKQRDFCTCILHIYVWLLHLVYVCACACVLKLRNVKKPARGHTARNCWSHHSLFISLIFCCYWTYSSSPSVVEQKLWAQISVRHFETHFSVWKRNSVFCSTSTTSSDVGHHSFLQPSMFLQPTSYKCLSHTVNSTQSISIVSEKERAQWLFPSILLTWEVKSLLHIHSVVYVVVALDLRSKSLDALVTRGRHFPLLWGTAANRVQIPTLLEKETGINTQGSISSSRFLFQARGILRDTRTLGGRRWLYSPTEDLLLIDSCWVTRVKTSGFSGVDCRGSQKSWCRNGAKTSGVSQ